VQDAAAVEYAYAHDVIVVASAGNSPGPVSSPANCPGALAITADDSGFQPWQSTASGPEVAFTAAGVDMVQTTIDGAELTQVSGTSDSAAITSGIFALLRSHFPNDSARQIVTRAIWNTHTGVGVGVRVGDLLGYGEILPTYALTEDPPPGAANPLYDAFDAELGIDTTGPTPVSSSRGPSQSGPSQSGPSQSGPSQSGPSQSGPSQSGPSSSAPSGPSTASSQSGSSGASVAAAGESSGGSSAGVIVGVAAGAVILLAVVGGVLLARRRSKGSGPPPPGPQSPSGRWGAPA
jgi:hypothetical protein